MSNSSVNVLWPTIVYKEHFGKKAFHDMLIKEIVAKHRVVSKDSSKDYLVERHNLFDNPSDAARSLMQLVIVSVRKMLEDIYRIEEADYKLEIQAQIGFTRPRSHLPLHDHSKNDFAAVYYPQYLKVKDGGILRLFDHRRWRKKFKSKQEQFHDNDWFEIMPEEGLLVIFPGFVPHDVSTWFGEEDRLTVNMVINVKTHHSHRLVEV